MTECHPTHPAISLRARQQHSPDQAISLPACSYFCNSSWLWGGGSLLYGEGWLNPLTRCCCRVTPDPPPPPLLGLQNGEGGRGGGLMGGGVLLAWGAGPQNTSKVVMSNQRFFKIVCFRFPTNVPQKIEYIRFWNKIHYRTKTSSFRCQNFRSKSN